MCNNSVVVDTKNYQQHTIDECGDQFVPIVKKLTSLRRIPNNKPKIKQKQLSLFETKQFQPPKDLSKISILNI